MAVVGKYSRYEGELSLLVGPLFKYFLEYFVSKYLEYEGELGLLVLFLNICLNIQDMRELVLFLLQGAPPLSGHSLAQWPSLSSKISSNYFLPKYLP